MNFIDRVRCWWARYCPITFKQKIDLDYVPFKDWYKGYVDLYVDKKTEEGKKLLKTHPLKRRRMKV